MELSSGQQRGLFVVIVIGLAGLLVYLLTAHGGHSGGAPSQSATSTVGAQPQPGPSGAGPAGSTAAAPGSALAPPEGVTSAKGQANIYSWLPFSQAGLTSAAQATLAFASDYGTYTYTETPAAYIGKMNGVITGALANTLKASYGSPQAVSQRTQQKQASQGSGGITQIRSFTSGSITFLVNIAQKLTTAQNTTTSTTQYAVTCVPGPGNWEVNDIEYASAGNS
jgi:hypothetical protein